MVVSQNRGARNWIPKYYNSYYRDAKKGTLIFGKPPYLCSTYARVLLFAKEVLYSMILRSVKIPEATK